MADELLPGFAPLASQADLDRAEEDTGDAHAPRGLGAALARAVAAFRSRR